MIPTQCHLWQKENLKPEDFKWEMVKSYWQESHEWRNLVKCKECGQLYINDNVEMVDWEGGNDKIITTIVPVSEEELEKYDFSKIPPMELLNLLPQIRWGIFDEGGLIKIVWAGRK